MNNQGQHQWEEKLTWLDLWNLLTINLPPLYDLIISAHVTPPPKNLPKKVCSPMQNFFMKKVPQYFVAGRGDTMLYLETFYHLYEFIRNFLPTLCF